MKYDEHQIMRDRAQFFGLDKTDSIADFKTKYLEAAETIGNSGKVV